MILIILSLLWRQIHKYKNPHDLVNINVKNISQSKFYHIPAVKIFDFFMFPIVYKEITYPTNYVLLTVSWYMSCLLSFKPSIPFSFYLLFLLNDQYFVAQKTYQTYFLWRLYPLRVNNNKKFLITDKPGQSVGI